MTEKLAFAGGRGISCQLGAVLKQLDSFKGQELAIGLQALLGTRPKVSQALLADLARQCVEGGDGQRAVRNPFNQNGKYTYISPWALPSAGAAAFVTAADPNTGEMFVLLGRKTREDGYEFLVPPGGYMEVKPPKGRIDRNNLPFDKNLAVTAIRETLEETTLDLTGFNVTPTQISSCSTYGKTDPKDRHSIFESYHFPLIVSKDELPEVHGHDDLEEKLGKDGSKEGGAFWVNVRDISVTPQTGEQVFTSMNSRYHAKIGGDEYNIMDCYGPALAEAVTRARKHFIDSMNSQEGSQQPCPDPATASLLEDAKHRFTEMVENMREQTAQRGLRL